MSKYEIDGGLADSESKVPLLVIIPELWVDHVQLKLESLTLDEIPVGEGRGGLGVHQSPIEVGGIALFSLHHPGDAHVEEAALGDVHVDGPGLLLFGEKYIQCCSF